MIDLDTIESASFEFKHNGNVYSVPTIDALDADAVLDLVSKENVSEADVFMLFKSVVAEHAPEALHGMSLAKLKALVAGWQTTGNVGESSPSSD